MLPRRKKRPSTKPAPDRVRSVGHLAYVRGFECAIANRHDCEGKTEAAHIRLGTDGGTGIKPSDCYAIPLCAEAHAEQHRIGERSFEAKYGVPGWTLKLSADLWRASPHRIKWEQKREMETTG